MGSGGGRGGRLCVGHAHGVWAGAAAMIDPRAQSDAYAYACRDSLNAGVCLGYDSDHYPSERDRWIECEATLEARLATCRYSSCSTQARGSRAPPHRTCKVLPHAAARAPTESARNTRRRGAVAGGRGLNTHREGKSHSAAFTVTHSNQREETQSHEEGRTEGRPARERGRVSARVCEGRLQTRPSARSNAHTPFPTPPPPPTQSPHFQRTPPTHPSNAAPISNAPLPANPCPSALRKRCSWIYQHSRSS